MIRARVLQPVIRARVGGEVVTAKVLSAGARIIPDPYAGPYAVTPTEAAQTLPTNGKTATENIIVGPIPQNYGKITWNGSFLTVS